jgi:hypothetical protein
MKNLIIIIMILLPLFGFSQNEEEKRFIGYYEKMVTNNQRDIMFDTNAYVACGMVEKHITNTQLIEYPVNDEKTNTSLESLSDYFEFLGFNGIEGGYMTINAVIDTGQTEKEMFEQLLKKINSNVELCSTNGNDFFNMYDMKNYSFKIFTSEIITGVYEYFDVDTFEDKVVYMKEKHKILVLASFNYEYEY